MVVNSARCFIGVVSLEHAKIGYAQKFTQVCHGKRSPLAKMSKGDWFVQYSPKMSLTSKDLYQKFSFVGRVKTGEVYQVKMAPGFEPYRIDIDYLSEDLAMHVPIRPLIDRLSFIEDKKNWGIRFRFGFLEVPREDFAIIFKEMTGSEMGSLIHQL